MAKTTIQSLRGMNDMQVDTANQFEYLCAQIKSILLNYGYQPFHTPIVESSQLFARAIGEATDIVEKEMFTFIDHDESVTLRPEATAGMVRAVNQHGLTFGSHKLWTVGPMFRRERPQKGRYRQFHQFSVECFGIPEPEVDAEQIIMLARLWQQLGVSDYVHLEINTLATIETRAIYRANLIDYYSKHLEILDEDSKRRLHKNPLRILDSKNPEMQAINADAPKLLDCLDEHSAQHFARVKQVLDTVGIKYTINPNLVRGLDYYNHTVFEWVTDQLGAQSTVCGGGRYDGLTEIMGGKYTACVGFGLGIERLMLLIEEVNAFPDNMSDNFLYLILLGESAKTVGMKLAETIRDEFPNKVITTSLQDLAMKTQMKKADQLKYKYVIIIGDSEIDSSTFLLKDLATGQQQNLNQNNLIEQLKKGTL